MSQTQKTKTQLWIDQILPHLSQEHRQAVETDFVLTGSEEDPILEFPRAESIKENRVFVKGIDGIGGPQLGLYLIDGDVPEGYGYGTWSRSGSVSEEGTYLFWSPPLDQENVLDLLGEWVPTSRDRVRALSELEDKPIPQVGDFVAVSPPSLLRNELYKVSETDVDYADRLLVRVGGIWENASKCTVVPSHLIKEVTVYRLK